MKTKALISFTVTAKLICVFVFAYAKSRFSHDEAHIAKTDQTGWMLRLIESWMATNTTLLVLSQSGFNFDEYKRCMYRRSIVLNSTSFEPRHEKTCFLHMLKQVQTSCTLTTQLISTYVFATKLVQSFYFLSQKFQASSLQPGLCRT